MGILYISYDGALDPLGSSQVLPYLSGLVQKGFTLFLLTFEKREKLQRKEKLEELKMKISRDGIAWSYSVYHNRPPLAGTILDIVTGVIKGGARVLCNGIRIVHARGYISALIAVFLKKTFRVKFIFDMRGLWPDEKVDAGAWKRGGLIYVVFKFFERVFFRNADAVVVLSAEGKEFLKRTFSVKKDIFVIPTCADLELFKPGRDPGRLKETLHAKERFIILYPGSVGSWYMLDEMADFFKISADCFPKPLFLILNSGSHDMIKTVMRKKHICADDYYIQSSDYRDVPSWFNAADLALFFIKPVVSKIVSCPTKFGESIACGVPVVINEGIGDTGKIVREAGLGVVVESFSEDSYRKAIEQLKRLFADRHSIKNACRSAAEKYFSLADGVERYRGIYEKLLNQ